MDMKVHLLIRDDDGAETAEIEDLVLDSSGAIRLLAVKTGGWFEDDRTVLVPLSRIRHETTRKDGEMERRCVLSMTEQELNALPRFDADEVRDKNALEARIRSVESSFPRTGRDDEGMQRERRPGASNDSAQRGRPDGDAQTREATEASMRAHGYLLASDLLELDVRASDDSFGSVSDAAMNLDRHRIDYLIVSHGGTLGIGGDEFLVPVVAARMTFESEEGSNERKCRLALPKTVAELERGVRFEDPDGEVFIASDAAQRSHAFFGTEARGAAGMRGEPDDRMREKPTDDRGDAGKRGRGNERKGSGGRSDSERG